MSSISESGKVNFKRTEQTLKAFEGLARGAWPTKLKLIARGEELSSAARPRRPRSSVGSGADATKWETAPDIGSLEAQGTGPAGIRYRADVQTAWARVTADDPGTADEQAHGLLQRMLETAPPETEVAVLFLERPRAVKVWLQSRGRREVEELLISPEEADSTGGVFLSGKPDFVVAAVLAKVGHVQRHGPTTYFD